MYNWNPQPIEDADKEVALEWYQKHKAHVDKVVQVCQNSGYPPCGSDCLHPELWKPEHWVWLFKTMGLTSSKSHEI